MVIVYIIFRLYCETNFKVVFSCKMWNIVSFVVSIIYVYSQFIT
jgi:hypothetical protein